ncbi:MAG TPA: peptidylprolyl isomerase [Bacteroidetes bacterium]|nr:peptidylprolyl isomerase [Bacteroidota bacterium]
MSQAKNGDTVKVHYTGTLKDGSVFDSSREREPLEFTLGSGQLIPGFEEAVVGMNIGDSKTVTIAADDAYGQYRDDMRMEVPMEQFPDNITPEVGQQLQLSNPDGSTFLVVISEISDSGVTLDANHPLAGKDLTFEIELVEVV